ncbi:MAG: polyphosphate kinase 1 [Verrucomicrobiota bacterium]
MSARFSQPEYFINRELSWLEFNYRVLEEAQDPHQPLLERVKFMCIVTSNLDEFFEIRMAGVKLQIENEVSDAGPDGMTASEVFAEARQKVLKIYEDQYRLWNEELKPELADNSIYVKDYDDLTDEERLWCHDYFEREVFPVLTPLSVDASHPFPQLRNKSHNLILLLRRPNGQRTYGIVQIPRVIHRLVELPSTDHNARQFHYILLKNLIQAHVHELYPGLTVEGVYGFRITRNSDLYIDEEEAENLLRTIEEELRKRGRGNAVRLEVQHDMPREVQQLLLENLRLTAADLYVLNGPVNILHLQPLAGLDLPELRDRAYVPIAPEDLPPDEDALKIIRDRDVMLHHPYESFGAVVDLVERASRDPQTLAIKMTLYRTSGNSPIVKSLIRAAENGKQVTALVELKARFDEANNIQWAKQLEESGVQVVYGVVGLKTHSKLLMIVRREDDGIIRYCHLGTGNYHPTTAKFYTDLGMITAKAEITEEVARLFNILTGLGDYTGVEKLLVAPFEMSQRFLELIAAERDLARAGMDGRIIAKVNSLVDEEIIEALYEASCAGVKTDLIVRGICCLRPGIPGVSENIRVRSIVGRFLEHHRIFYFGNNGDPRVFLGSADWMPRNLHRRVEVAFPVEDERLRARLTDAIIPTFLEDNMKARQLQRDGSYVRVQPQNGAEPKQAQLTFRETAREMDQQRSRHEKEARKELTPVFANPEETAHRQEHEEELVAAKREDSD